MAEYTVDKITYDGNTYNIQDLVSGYTSNTGTVTGSGTSGYLVKFNGSSSITKGPQLGSSTTTYLRRDGTWATPPGTTYSAVTNGGLTLSSGTFAVNVATSSTSDSGTTRYVRADSSGNLYVTQKDDDTQYSAGDGIKLTGTTFSLNLPMIMTKCSTALSLKTTYQKVTLESALNINSNVFTISSGGVKCLKSGIVLINGAVDTNAGVSDQDILCLKLFRNSTEIRWAGTRACGASYASTYLTSILTYVDANDIFYLHAANTSSARGTVPGSSDNTYLTVAYVDY